MQVKTGLNLKEKEERLAEFCGFEYQDSSWIWSEYWPHIAEIHRNAYT